MCVPKLWLFSVLYAGKLSESEGEEDEEEGSGGMTMETQQYIDETAQGFGMDEDGTAGYLTSGAPMQMDDDEISFDPAEFFLNSALASAAGASGSNINDDLQVSDSDEEDGGQEEAPIIPTENQNDEGFDIDQYFWFGNVVSSLARQMCKYLLYLLNSVLTLDWYTWFGSLLRFSLDIILCGRLGLRDQLTLSR